MIVAWCVSSRWWVGFAAGFAGYDLACVLVLVDIVVAL